MEKPDITTAIPKRRYQLGDYTAILLGEIEGTEQRDYRYILAMVREGESQPSLFVTSERRDGTFLMRIFTEAFADELDASDDWGDLDRFAEKGLHLAGQTLGIAEAEPMRLM